MLQSLKYEKSNIILIGSIIHCVSCIWVLVIFCCGGPRQFVLMHRHIIIFDGDAWMLWVGEIVEFMRKGFCLSYCHFKMFTQFPILNASTNTVQYYNGCAFNTCRFKPARLKISTARVIPSWITGRLLTNLSENSKFSPSLHCFNGIWQLAGPNILYLSPDSLLNTRFGTH